MLESKGSSKKNPQYAVMCGCSIASKFSSMYSAISPTFVPLKNSAVFTRLMYSAPPLSLAFTLIVRTLSSSADLAISIRVWPYFCLSRLTASFDFMSGCPSSFTMPSLKVLYAAFCSSSSETTASMCFFIPALAFLLIRLFCMKFSFFIEFK